MFSVWTHIKERFWKTNSPFLNDSRASRILFFEIFDKNPSLPALIPSTGTFESLIKFIVLIKVPSPPILIIKSMFDSLKSMWDLKVFKLLDTFAFKISCSCNLLSSTVSHLYSLIIEMTSRKAGIVLLFILGPYTAIRMITI